MELLFIRSRVRPATWISRSPVEFITKRSASGSSWKSGKTRPGGDTVFQAMSGLGVPTTSQRSRADCSSAILTVGGGERIKLGASAATIAHRVNVLADAVDGGSTPSTAVDRG